MNVRPFHELDKPELEAIRATCPPGAFFADPAEAANTLSFVVEDRRGVLGVVVYRMTAEPLLYVNQTLPPAEKWDAIETLARETGPKLLERGIRELHLFPNDDTFAWRLARKFKGAFGDLRRHIVWNISQAFGG